MNLSRPLLIVIALFLSFPGSAQVSKEESYPQNYFRSPLDLAPQASGSFGELRSNHFHAGTDYRTNQREGYPVFAVADGFISRARVQIGGGGHALYIDHPNGYTSVYMHLQKFNDKIGKVVKDKQYTDQQFSVDFPPGKGVLAVKKGDIIAFSGNTGGSGGPHLHFELRNTATEAALNPQLFGLLIPDNVPPAISGFTVYRLGQAPFSELSPREQIPVTGANGRYKLQSTGPIKVNGNTGFGLIAIDQNSASANRNGIYSLELLMDGAPIFKASMASIYFHHSRAMNSYIDYPHYILKSQRIQKAFIEPGNPLTIYQDAIKQGLLNITDDQVHEMSLLVKDVKGNTSTISFSVQNDPALKIEQNLKNGTLLFPFDKDNQFQTLDMKLSIPKNSLYSDLNFTYSVAATPSGGYSPLHHIHNRMIPIHQSFSLSLLAKDLPEALKSKALILDSRGRSKGGSYAEDGYVHAKVNELGSFYVGVDITPPSIRPVNISENKGMSSASRISFKISDNLSGIQTFNGYLNEEWVLMEYDPKTSSLWHVFEKGASQQKQHFKLVVKDGKENETVYEVNFIR